MTQKKVKPRRQKHIPQRTCIVCRQQFDKRRLTRIVRTPDIGVVTDPTGKRNGRGAYLCDQPACWDKVLREPHVLYKALMIAELSLAEREAIAAARPATADMV